MNEPVLMKRFMRDLQLGMKLPKMKAWHPSDRFIVGIHDQICVINGRFVAIEFKKGFNLLSAPQRVFQSEILNAGGISVIVSFISCKDDKIVCNIDIYRGAMVTNNVVNLNDVKAAAADLIKQILYPDKIRSA